MAFDQGIDFRNTAVFVTDPTGCTSEIGTTANYPRVTPQGNNVGWEDAIGANTRNRSAAIDARLAGVAFTPNGASPKRYRIDLPSSGWYRITLAVGDTSTEVQNVEVFDGTTIVSNVVTGNIVTPANQWFDACGELRSSAADWVTNEVSFVAFFSTTICRIRIGNSSVASGNTTISHIRVTDAVQPSPSLNGGVDFRVSGDFVADPTNCSSLLAPNVTSPTTAAANYPHITAQGLKVGWEQAFGGHRNRSAAVDARLAGVGIANDAAQANFRIDLPAAGAFRIAAAIGDATNSQTHTVELFDGSSSLGTIVSAAATAAGQFYDASGTLRTSAANWVSAQQQITKSFATTILRLKCGAAAGSNNTTLAHVSITQLAGITGTSSLSALINRFRKIVATIAGVGTLTASVIRATARTATIAGTSSLSATITGLHRFITATVAGTSSLAATLTGGRIGTATISGTSSLSATISTGGVVKNFTATIAGTSSIRAVTPYILHSSGEITLQGDDATVTTYLALGSAQIFLNADAPTFPSGYQPTSGVIKLAAGSATQPSLVQPSAGVIVVRADAPNLFASYKPVSGVIALRGDPPNVIPYSTPSAVIRVTADPPLEQPITGVSGRIILTGGPHSVIPIQVTASGVILLKADPADFAHVGIILNQSGIIRLRSDVPVVTPLTEPPPPPPPPPPGTGLAVSGTE